MTKPTIRQIIADAAAKVSDAITAAELQIADAIIIPEGTPKSKHNTITRDSELFARHMLYQALAKGMKKDEEKALKAVEGAGILDRKMELEPGTSKELIHENPFGTYECTVAQPARSIDGQRLLILIKDLLPADKVAELAAAAEKVASPARRVEGHIHG